MKEKIYRWMDAESKSFSIMCGERFTHREVIMMHGYLLMVFVGVLLAGVIAR